MSSDREAELRRLQELARSDKTLRLPLRDAWSLGWIAGLDDADGFSYRSENPFFADTLEAGASS